MQNNFNSERNNTQINQINVYFRQHNFGERRIISVRCEKNEKVSSLIEKYRNLSGDFDDDRKFIFKAKNLQPNLTVAEAGITNNENIFIINTRLIKGLSNQNNISIFN